MNSVQTRIYVIESNLFSFLELLFIYSFWINVLKFVYKSTEKMVCLNTAHIICNLDKRRLLIFSKIHILMSPLLTICQL